ncbi:MAG TPA: DUF115 domain-containing protein [bacterium]|nr:DUF115 domain-containing protein [bacterium]
MTEIKINNNNYLRDRHKDFFDFLNTSKYGVSFFSIEGSKIGLVPNVYFSAPDNPAEKIYLNSRINPEKEMERIIGAELKKNCGLSPVFAEFLGGYETAAFGALKQSKNFRAVYIVLFPELFKQIIEKFDISFLREYDISFIFGESIRQLQSSLFRLDFNREEYKIIVPQNLIKAIRMLKPEFEVLAEFFEGLSTKKNYKDKFKDLIEKNVEQNKKFINKNNGIIQLKKNPLKKIGALIGAGPSVDDYIEDIKKHKDILTIIAVDAALPIMEKKGIKPDFTISVDPQEHCLKFFQNGDYGETILIFSPYSFYKIIERYTGGKYYFISTNHPVLDELKNELDCDFNSELGGGASVSIYALDFLIRLGFEKIVFTGQDFGFTNGLTYSKHSYYYDSLYKKLNKYDSIETDYYRLIIEKSAIKSRGVYTLHNLKNYMFEFERYLEINKNIEFFNMNRNGLKVKDSKNINSVLEIE